MRPLPSVIPPRSLPATGALYPTTEEHPITNSDKANLDFFAGIESQLNRLAEQRALRQTAINRLEIGATSFAKAALETAGELGLNNEA